MFTGLLTPPPCNVRKLERDQHARVAADLLVSVKCHWEYGRALDNGLASCILKIHGAFLSPSHFTTQLPSSGKPGAGLPAGAPSQPAAIMAVGGMQQAAVAGQIRRQRRTRLRIVGLGGV